jgi:hypothetical protein
MFDPDHEDNNGNDDNDDDIGNDDDDNNKDDNNGGNDNDIKKNKAIINALQYPYTHQRMKVCCCFGNPVGRGKYLVRILDSNHSNGILER